MAQQVWRAPWLWTEKTENEKGWCKDEDQGRFDFVSLEGQASLEANMSPPPAEVNFCDNSNHPVKPHVVELCNWHMGYFVGSDRVASGYSMSRCNFKWTMKLFFHLLDLTVLRSWIVVSSCGAIYTHQDFRLPLVWNLIEEHGRSEDCPTPRLVGRPIAATADVPQLSREQH